MKKFTFSFAIIAFTAAVLCTLSPNLARAQEMEILPVPGPGELPAPAPKNKKNILEKPKPESELTPKEKFARLEAKEIIKRLSIDERKYNQYIRDHGNYFPTSPENRKKIRELVNIAIGKDKAKSSESLEKIVELGETALPVLRKLKETKNHVQAMVCASAIDRINKNMVDKLPSIVKMLKDKNWKTRNEGFGKLILLGQAIIPSLEKLTRSKDCEVASRARDALVIYNGYNTMRLVPLWKKYGVWEQMSQALNDQFTFISEKMSKYQAMQTDYRNLSRERYAIQRQITQLSNALRIIQNNSKVDQKSKKKEIEKLKKEISDLTNTKNDIINNKLPKLKKTYDQANKMLRQIRPKFYRIQNFLQTIDKIVNAEADSKEKVKENKNN